MSASIIEIPPAREWLSELEVALILGFTDRTVRNLISRGDLPAYRVGSSRTVRIARRDVELLMQPISAERGAA